MKKVFLWVVLMGVFFSFPGVAAEQGNLHLLWDIPFGISMEECAELIYEKHGIVMKRGTLGTEYEHHMSSDNTQEIHFLERSARIFLEGDEQDHLRQARIVFNSLPISSVKQGWDDFLDIYEQASQQYGPATGGRLRHVFDEEDERIEKEYSIPTIAGGVDLPTLITRLDDLRDGDFLYLDLAMGNVTVTFNMFLIEDSSIAWRRIQYDNQTSLLGFEGLDGELQLKKKVVEVGF